MDRNIRPPSKMKKYVIYNFLIMKTRHMKDKVERHINLEQEEILILFLCILVFMLNFEIYF